MDYVKLFDKIFTSDKPVYLGNHMLVIRKEDGYVNAGKLCKAGNKQFTDWYRHNKAKEYLAILEKQFIEAGITTPLIDKDRSRNRHGTYVHPIVAINIAQWISPECDVSVSQWICELFINGQANTNNPTSLQEIEKLRNEKLMLETKYNQLVINHEKIKTKKTQHKFKNGNCFYLVRNISEADEKYKFGITNNITNRIRTYRTISPLLYIHRIIYLKEHLTLEKYVKIAFNVAKNDLNNHEFIIDTDIDIINQKVDYLLKLFDNVEEIDQDELKQINKKILNGMVNFENGQEKHKTSEKVKELYKKVNKLENIIQEKVNESKNNVEKQVQVEKTINLEYNQKNNVEKQVQVEKTINLNYKYNQKQFTISELDGTTPVEHKITKHDFEKLDKYVDDLHERRNQHKWILIKFIIYICYYSGIPPKVIISMTGQNIKDYIDGKQVVVNSYVIFTNDFISEKIQFFQDKKNLIKPEGMINSFGRKLTYRQLEKWLTPVFDKLETENFGRVNRPGRYSLMDLRKTFITNLYNSDIPESEIAKFVNHKNVTSTMRHI
jgi:hypothetical protein